jgi:hypothetical protein
MVARKSWTPLKHLPQAPLFHLSEVLEDVWCWRVLHASSNLPHRRDPDLVVFQAVDGADAQNREKGVNQNKFSPGVVVLADTREKCLQVGGWGWLTAML